MTRAEKLRELIRTAEMELHRIERNEGTRRSTRAVHRVIDASAVKHGVTIGDLLAHDRRRIVVRARQEAAWTLRHQLDLSYPQIGAYMNLHHTSVMYAVRQHANRLERAKVRVVA